MLGVTVCQIGYRIQHLHMPDCQPSFCPASGSQHQHHGLHWAFRMLSIHDRNEHRNVPDCVYQGRQCSLMPSFRESIQRRVPTTGTMPSMSPENTCNSHGLS